jgi:DNA-binding XRE family transcriptional regulator
MPSVQTGDSKERARPKSELSKRLHDKGYLLCTEAARKVGVNRATIYRWIKERAIDTLDINGAYYVSWSSILVHLGDAAAVLGYEDIPGVKPGNRDV